MAPGSWSPNRGRSRRNTWSMPPAYGLAKWERWRASTILFIRWSTNIWSPMTSRRSTSREEELPHVIDPGGETYFRQEGRGLVLGIYEQEVRALGRRGNALGLRARTVAGQARPHFEAIGKSVSALSLPCRPPASRPLSTGRSRSHPTATHWSVPIPGLKGYWCACAVLAGFSQGGGVGLTGRGVDDRG